RIFIFIFFFQAEDGIRDRNVTGVQTCALPISLRKARVPIIIVDSSWEKLRYARKEGVPFYHGEMLSEQTEYNLDTIPYEYIIAATDFHSYNALVCTTFMPEYGRTNVFKISPFRQIDSSSSDIVSKIGGRILFKEKMALDDLNEKINNGYIFRQTTITQQYSYKQYVEEKDDATVFLYVIKPSGQIRFYAEDTKAIPGAGDIIVSLTPPNKEIKKIQAKLENQRSNGTNNGTKE